MSQRTPEYTEADFERVLAREFPGGTTEAARGVLMSYGVDESHAWPLRVRMACMKLAAGDIEELRKYVQAACGDPRDVLAWGEYGNSWNAKGAAELREALKKDQKELKEWLLRK